LAIPAESVARAVAFAIEQPADVDINEIVIARRHRISEPSSPSVGLKKSVYSFDATTEGSERIFDALANGFPLFI